MNYFFKRYDAREAASFTLSSEKMGVLFLREAVLEFLKDQTLTGDDVVICNDTKGKPYIKINGEDSSLSVSLSHKDYFVAVGIGELPCSVGVDVERIRPFSKILIEGFLCAEELSAFNSYAQSDSSRYLAMAWSYKECVMKLSGLGLRVHPKRINVLNLMHAKQGESTHFLLDNEEVSCTVGYSTVHDGYVFVGLSMCGYLLAD